MEDCLINIEQQIKALAQEYASTLRGKIDDRREEMKLDDLSHYLTISFITY